MARGLKRTRRNKIRGGAYSPLGAGEQTIVGTLLVEHSNPSGPIDGGYKSVAETTGGRRRRSRKTKRVPVATLKRLLKAKGMKVSGSRRAITARARKARIPMKGGGATTGTAYGAYAGDGTRGMTNQFSGAHPVDNGVMRLPDTAGGSFYETPGGGWQHA